MLAGRLPQWLSDGLPGLFGRCQELRSVLGGVAGGRGDVRMGGRGGPAGSASGAQVESTDTFRWAPTLHLFPLGQCLPEG